MRRPWRVGLAAAGLGGLLLGLIGLDALDRAAPPDLTRLDRVSLSVVDREGRLLRAFAVPGHAAREAGGAMRLPAAVGEVDPAYLDMLIGFEDRRFRRHLGVDPLAMARAVWQMLRHGRVVSGGSTLTMQVVRLLEPRPRTVGAKLIEMARAVQLERRFSKDEILGMYLTLAPFGGNLEGVRAGSLSYFGKEPARLTTAEAALLVALPQAPSRLRPDRAPAAARAARDKVLGRLAEGGVLAVRRAAEAMEAPVPDARRPLPFLAPHATRQAALQARRMAAGGQAPAVIRTTLDRDLQEAVEALAARHAAALEPAAALAALVIDHRDAGAVRAYLGSPDYFDARRAGAVDMVRALRSPGSALKPALYAMAFDATLAHPATRVQDRPRQFGGYAPGNFDGRYHGELTLGEALTLSLNIPAVALLSRVGPLAFARRLEDAGTPLRLSPVDPYPGLALALGGAGISLQRLAMLYAGLAVEGGVRPLRLLAEGEAEAPRRLVGPVAAWQVAEVLRTTPPPGAFGARTSGGQRGAVAFKTGTSYGFRDAWAFGFDGRYTIGIWVGRPDGTPRPGVDGRHAAAPLLFALFDLLPPDPARALPDRPPEGASALARTGLGDTAALPAALRRLEPAVAEREDGAPPLAIAFPPDGATVELVVPGGAAKPLPLVAEGGQRPFRWLVNGRPVPPEGRRADRATWRPDGPGFADITLIDGRGTARRVQVWVE